MKAMITGCLAAAVVVMGLLSGGCVSREEFERCTTYNETLRQRIAALEAQVDDDTLCDEKLQQEREQRQRLQELCNDKLSAMERALQDKNAEIAKLAEMVGQPVNVLPPELTSELERWAEQVGTDLVTFDEQRGLVRFKSDLLFDKGSADVQTEAAQQLKALADIMNRPSADAFDVLIVGHSDNLRLTWETKQKHPTNWHLSAHRAISVEQILADAGIAQTRMAVMGMGEFHPIEPNAPNFGGNPKNRRVDIYIVPAGQISIRT